LKCVSALDVHRVVVGVDVFCEIDLGLVAMYEAHFVVATDFAGFLSVDCIVLRADDLLDILLIRKVCFEGSNFYHYFILR